jgi:hypothetical protein
VAAADLVAVLLLLLLVAAGACRRPPLLLLLVGAPACWVLSCWLTSWGVGQKWL